MSSLSRIVNGYQIEPLADLRGANLRGAHLEGAHLEGANLEHAHLEHAHLGGAHLEGANLERAHLRLADLFQAHLENANLLRANLQHTNLVGAHLEGANLEGANLDGVHLEGASLTSANLRGAYLAYARLERANLEEADLRGADLHNAHLEEANLEFAQLDGATTCLRYARLERASLTGASFDGANLRGAHLMHTQSNGTYFTYANLENADFRGANLHEARLDHANLVNADLRGANLRGANLEAANVDRANLEGANLIDTILAPVAHAPVAHAPHAGLAFEVHNLFGMLDIAKLRAIIQSEAKPINPKTLPGNDESLFGALRAFVINSDMEPKDAILANLETVLPLVQGSDAFASNPALFTEALGFVARQSDTFIQLYIEILRDECTNAYGAGGASCVAGMVERIVTAMNGAALGLPEDDPSFPIVEPLKEVFKTVDFQETVQEWFTLYALDGTRNGEIAGLTPELRKRHFIDFMKRKYFVESQAYQGADVRTNIERRITEEAGNLEEAGIFETLIAGIRRKRVTRKRSKLSRHSKKRSKRTKSSRKRAIKK